MINEIVKAWDSGAREAVRETFLQDFPSSYNDIVKTVITELSNFTEGTKPDPKRICTIDDGDYQGTLVFIIGAQGCQPSTYWACKISYGSCSHCDTFGSIRSDKDWEDESPGANESQISQLMQLALHIVQNLKEI